MGGGYRKTRFNIHQRVWIITVFVLVISLMVGYAVMDNTFELNGTSKITATTLIRITNIKHVDSNASGEGKIEGNIKGILPTEFSGNGSTSYQVTVKNEGSTSGILSTINLVNESNNKNPSCITMKIEGLQVGDILTPSQEQTFTVTVTNTCGGSGGKENEFSLSYIPVNGEGDTTTIDEKINLLQAQIDSTNEQLSNMKSLLGNGAFRADRIYAKEITLDRLDFINDDEIYILRFSPAPPDNPEDGYLHGGVSYIVIGFEYYERDFGAQLTISPVAMKYRTKISGVWSSWKTLSTS